MNCPYRFLFQKECGEYSIVSVIAETGRWRLSTNDTKDTKYKVVLQICR